MLNAFEPIVEKLEVRLLLAACIAVMISINAKIPNAMMITVMDARSLFPFIYFQESDKMSLCVIPLFFQRYKSFYTRIVMER
jgi:hypothetical protein